MFTRHFRIPMKFQSQQSQRGSIVLSVALVIIVLATLLAGYLRVATTELTNSHASIYFNAALNLAEGGAELAILAINNETGPDADWKSDGGTFIREIDNVPLAGTTNAQIFIQIEDYASEHPVIISEGRVLIHGGRWITRQIMVEMEPMPIRGAGVVALNRLNFVGGASTYDSYKSSDGPWGGDNRRSEITVGSISVEEDVVDIGNATIYGYVATGGSDPQLGPNGKVISYELATHDPSRISTDFVAQYPPIEPPDNTDAFTSLTYLHSETGSGNSRTLTIGNATGTIEHYSLESMNFRNLVVDGPVIIEVNDDFRMSGNTSITIKEGGSLTIYTRGDFDIDGNAIANATNIPANFKLYGIGDHDQHIDVGGTTNVYALIYAPKADITLRGTSTMHGSVVGNNIFANGGHTFRFDEDSLDIEQTDLRRPAYWEERVRITSIAF